MKVINNIAMSNERRYYSNENLEFRAITEDDRQYLEGYAILFDVESRLIYENNKLFYEKINRSAVNGVLEDENIDVVATYNHNREVPLARFQPSKGKVSLQLSVDERGVKFKFEVINTTLARDIAELVDKNIVTECSFVFSVAEGGEKWTRKENGDNLREITQFSGLYDISIVVDGAYEQTFSQTVKRNLEESEIEQPIYDNEKFKLDNDVFIFINGLSL